MMNMMLLDTRARLKYKASVMLLHMSFGRSQFPGEDMDIREEGCRRILH